MRLDDILNYVPLTDELATSGQPDAGQFEAIAMAGYVAVINLALPTSPGALPEEANIVSALGMRYYPIPVPFDAPTPAHLQAFIQTMVSLRGQKVWIHCAANYRVSAFMNRYAALVEGVPTPCLHSPMFERWQPDAIWQRFMQISQEQISQDKTQEAQ